MSFIGVAVGGLAGGLIGGGSILGGALIGGAVSGALGGGKGGKVEAPPARDYGSEGANTLAAQIALAPDLYAAESNPDYGLPAYARLQTGVLKDTVPQLQTLQEQATTSQRTADIADVENLGSRATAAFKAANPQLAAIQDALSQRALAGGDSALNQELQRQAMADLKLGGQLSPDQQRMVEQQARSAYNARGIARGDAGAFAEALNGYRYSNALQQQRRGFAQSVDSQALQREQYGSNLLGTTGQFLSSTSADPFQAILGRSAAPQSVPNAGFSLQSQPQIFNPYDPYAGGIYASNQQNQMDAATASAANRASIQGSFLGSLGTIGAALICWVARSAYGPDNPRWLVFREWMVKRSPLWLLQLYYFNGERWAKKLDERPRLKPFIRSLMDLTLKFA